MSTKRFFTWLYQHSRGIGVRGENVTVLRSPDEFYQTILDQIRGARRRVKMSSLYLGTGELEKELVRSIGTSLQEAPRLECHLLLDYLRGTRGQVNSVTTLIDLLKSSSRTHLHLYHTPLLQGIVKRMIPERFNEGVGLQHTKILLFDDNVIMTGANLSNDYFTKRRDRYILFRNSKELSDYISTLYDIICDHSHLVRTGDDRQSWSTIGPQYDPLDESTDHKLSMETSIKKLISIQKNNSENYNSELTGTRRTDSCSTPQFQSSTNVDNQTHSCSPDAHSEPDSQPSTDTVVFPLIQMGPYNIKQDESVTTELLSNTSKNDRICLASGYFNPPPEYTSAILKGQGSTTVLAASPQANGFYGAKGVAKYTPFMYVYYAQVFLEMISKQCRNNRIQYHEYVENGWVFHSKGLWYYRGDHAHPCLTLIGSTNYGFRSLTRDLEFQVAIATDNKELQLSLNDEMIRLFSKGTRLTLHDVLNDSTRKLSPLVLLATKLLQKYV